MSTPRSHDDGALEIGWLTRLVAVLAVVGVLGFDGFSVVSARVRGEDDAQNAAYAASQAWHQTRNITTAYQAAVASVNPAKETILTQDFSVDTDGTVHLLLRRDAQSVVLKRFSATRRWTVETLHGDDDDDN